MTTKGGVMPDVPLPGYDPDQYLPGEELLKHLFTPMELDARARRLLPPLSEPAPFRSQSDRSRAIINAEIAAGLRPAAQFDANGNPIRFTRVLDRAAVSLLGLDLSPDRFIARPPVVPLPGLPAPVAPPERFPFQLLAGIAENVARGAPGVIVPVPPGANPPSGFVEVPAPGAPGRPVNIGVGIGVIFPPGQEPSTFPPEIAPPPRPKTPPTDNAGNLIPNPAFPDELFQLNPADP